MGAALATRLIDKAPPASSPRSRAVRADGRRSAGAARRRAVDWLPRLGGIAAVLVVLEICSRTGVLPRESFPPVSEIYASLLGLVTDTPMWVEVGRTMRGWAVGLLLAAVLAVPLGMLLGASRLAFQISRLVIEFLRPVPSVALIPLAVLVFGAGIESKWFLAAFAATWPILLQTLYGVRDVDPVGMETARSFGVKTPERLLRVVLPSALPYIVTGVRISSAVALILSVTAELVLGAPGLGQQINIARQSGAVESMYALIIVTGLIGWVLNIALSAAERRLLHWHASQRERNR